MLERLKLLYPFVDENLLGLVVDNARAFVLYYCNLTEEDLDSLDAVIFRMCQEDLNRCGAEGYTAESLEGNSVSYGTDYSPQIYRFLNMCKKVRYV